MQTGTSRKQWSLVGVAMITAISANQATAVTLFEDNFEGLNPGMPYTAPLWLGEFGIGHASTDNAWWACLREFMASTDVDWSYWALNGTQGPGYGRTDGAEEGYGVLNASWSAPANAVHLRQLQALVPARLGL